MKSISELFGKAKRPEIISMTARELTDRERTPQRTSSGWRRIVTQYSDGTTREGAYVLTVSAAMARRMVAA